MKAASEGAKMVKTDALRSGLGYASFKVSAIDRQPESMRTSPAFSITPASDPLSPAYIRVVNGIRGLTYVVEHLPKLSNRLLP